MNDKRKDERHSENDKEGAGLGLRQNKGSIQVDKLRARDNMKDQGQVQRTGEGYKERTREKVKAKDEDQGQGPQGEMQWTRMNDKEEAEGTMDKDEGQ